MGKVQKKANEKHKSSLSPALKEFIDKTVSLPLSHLPNHLKSFPTRWPFPRGDLYNWIEPLDRFDEALQKFNSTYGLSDGPQTKPFGNILLTEGGQVNDTAELSKLGFEDDGDRVLIQSILSFSCLLLEKCGNRTLYNSTERLNDLLNTTSLPLLNDTLRLTLVLAQKFAERSPQPQPNASFYHFDMTRLQKIASPIPRQSSRKGPLSPVKTSKSREKQPKFRRMPTTADPNDFRALARQPQAAAQEGQSRSSGETADLDWTGVAMVRVVWPASIPGPRPAPSRNTTADSALSPTPVRHHPSHDAPVSPSNVQPKPTPLEPFEQSGLREIELAADDLVTQSIERVLQDAPDSMPSATRFELLHKLRVAYGLLSTDTSRNLLLESRLAALSIISRVFTEEELTARYFDGDTNASARQFLVQQLVSLLREPRPGHSNPSLAVQSLAIEALIALARFRQTLSEIISALSPNSNHGLMMSLVQRGLADIAHDDDATDNDIGDDWRHAVFTLWLVFMNESQLGSSRSTEQYVHKNLISAYASSLKVMTGKSLRIHFYVLKFLQLLFHHFRDGLQVLNANGSFAITCETTDKLCKQALELYQAGEGIPERWKTPGVDFKIPYQQQFVLRELVTLVKDVSKYQGNHADRALRGFVDSSSLLEAFRLILSNMEAFGAHTWSEVVTAVCGFLNNEPTSYTVVSEAGIISTLLDTVQPSASTKVPDTEKPPRTISDRPAEPNLKLPAITDAINNLATAFGAICLTEAGLNRFIASNVLEKFFELFESPAHLKAMRDTTAPIQLGSTFDELVRHHPKLRELVISSVITMLARVRHICRFHMKEAGAGPKIWKNGSAEPCVDGGVHALMAENIPCRDGIETDFRLLKLPNGDSIEFSPATKEIPESVAMSASEEDAHGLTTLDYARPAMGFLSAFLENHFLCKELLNTGVTDLIMDFVTLQTLPITEESFSEGLFMQDMITVVHLVSNDRPYLVLSLLIDRARYICNTALKDFINFNPDKLQCYFNSYLVAEEGSSAMALDSTESLKDGHATNAVQALMNVYGLARVLAEVFNAPSFNARPTHTSILPQLNVSDILSELIELLGRLSAACCREEMTLLATMPEALTVAARPPNYSTGDSSIDAIIGISNRKTAESSGEKDESKLDVEETKKHNENNPAFRNLKTLRYLLVETPAAISTMLSRVGSSFGGKSRKIETFVRQKVVRVSTALAQALTIQLEPPFISHTFSCDDVVLGKDTRFKYLAVTLVRLRDSLWEDNSSTPGSSIRQSFVVDCFRRAKGLEMLSNIGKNYYEELKSCQVDDTVCAALSANAGLKICLDLFAEFTHSDLINSHQTSYLRTTDAKHWYFNPNQLLLELRMESLPLARAIWDSEYAEQASNDIVRNLAIILKHTLNGENEDNVLTTADSFPKLKDPGKGQYELDASKVDALKQKHYPQDLVEEALYRCNSSSQIQHAEEYCKAVQGNPRRRRLPIPEGDVRYKGDRSTSPTTAPSNGTGFDEAPTTTILESGSLDDEMDDISDQGEPSNAAPVIFSELSRDSPAQSGSRREGSSASAMNISSILNDDQPIQSETPALARFSLQTINAERESIRENLADRCNNILSSHPTLIFDINDLLSAGASKLSGDDAKNWWERVTDLLVTSLISQNVDDDIDEAQGTKIAANAHLIGLLCNNEMFKPSMLEVLQNSVDDIIGFLKMPTQKPSKENTCPWIGPVLLILEKMLALDAEPAHIEFSEPNNLETFQEPTLVHNPVVEDSSKSLLFQRLMDMLPKVGKDRQVALSIVRVLVILTRERKLAQMQAERRNLQKLFLMVKQLGGSSSARLEGSFMSILRHVIEDDETIKQIMVSEISFFFRSRHPQRPMDLANYLRELNYLGLRSPQLFVEASNETVKLLSWSPGMSAATATLTLRERSDEQEPLAAAIEEEYKEPLAVEPAPTIEETTSGHKSEDNKPQEQKVPIVEHPDGIVHFLLSELLSYKEVEDKEIPSSDTLNSTAGTDIATSTSDAENNTPQDETFDKPEKARYKADDHPIFVYRCFLLHCLTELLYSYNQTKIEFISFSRKADPLAATPSKARSGVLNYLLGGLVSSGYVDKDDSISCRKRLVSSEWAMKVIVALCSKTGEKGLGSASASRYSSTHRHVEDNDSETDLSYVRRFVLDHAIKAFKDAASSSDPLQTRYGRLLCLSDLFYKLISKPSGPEGSVYSANNSYKKLARIMLEKNFLATLTSAISDIDLSFPGAKRVVKFILRPLKELTAMATDLSLNAPDQFPTIIDQADADTMSSASSDVSDIGDDEREETPDLYRNSALGMLDRARQEESDTEEDEDDEMEYDEYEDDMDYDEEVAPTLNDGEVVSDEELEDVIDGDGALEGIPGDVPMEIEYVVDHHHDEDDEDDEDDSSGDDEDDDSDDDVDDGEDIEIEIEDDEEANIDRDGSDGHTEDEGEDGWEDDGDDDQQDDEDEEIVAIDEDLPIPEHDGNATAHLDNLLRALAEPDVEPPELPQPGGLVTQINDAYEQEDDEDQDEDGEDMGENDGADYDQPFDMMLDGPDFDENDEWGWEEPPPPIFRRSRAARSGGAMPPFFSRRVVNMTDPHEMMHHMMSSRNYPHYRRAPQARGVAEDGMNPLLQRPDTVSSNGPSARAFTSGLPSGGMARGMPIIVTGDGGPPIPFTIDGGISGHGNILDAIVGAIQRGDPQVLQNGRLQLNVTGNFPGIEDLISGASSQQFPSRPPRDDPHRTASFIPMLTISRWQEEVRMLFGKGMITKTQPIQRRVYAALIPAAQEEAKKREEERKRQEVEAQRKAEEDRRKREEEERLAKEKAAAEEKDRAEAEAREAEAREAEQQAPGATQESEEDDAMEGVQASGEDQAAPEPAEAPARIYTTIRGRQLDITGLDIDADYLEALPEDLREEVITAQYQARREQAQEQGNEDSAIDQEFLDALPDDIREEIRAAEAAAQRRRERRREAQASIVAGQPGEMDNDDFFASLDPALRRAILAEQPPEILNGLNPQHAAEGRAQARSMFFHHRLPIHRDLDEARGRRGLAQRDLKRQQPVQLIDKAGVATLLRLMFVQQQGSLKSNLLNILSQICGNRQTRFEVVSLVLVILKEGSADVTAIERSLASLSLRAKAGAPQKTPQPLKRTLSMQPYAGLGDDVTPTLVVQQCLGTLKHICDHNTHVKSLFLREVDVTSANKAKGKVKGKNKETKTTTHPVNDLISLLDRRLIMDNAGCLLSLASLLSTITSPLASLMKQERERQVAEKKAEEDAQKPKEAQEKPVELENKEDVTMQDKPNDDSIPTSSQAPGEEQKEDTAPKEDEAQPAEPEKKKPFDPPTVADHNLKLITNIFVAPECGNDTFRYTIATLQSLSHIPDTSQKFGEELTRHVHNLSQTICTDLDELLPAIEDAQSSTDVQGAAAAKFSASASDQVKLLRVLQALDYLTAPKKEDEASGDVSKSILTLSYEGLGLGPLWTKLSSCLSAVEEKGDTISFANILLPLIESLMVVCKHTTLKDTPVQVKEATVTNSVATTYKDDLEELFFKFTSDHRKILNDIVRQSPKLMQGHFAILVKNNKVLDFDNKRNYFNKQIHSRHHAQRHPQPPLQLNVRRDQVFNDSYKALYFKSADEMKYGKLSIRFNGEEGVDAGGVTREWFQVLARGMFDPNYALFQPVASDKTTFHPNPLSQVNPEHLLYFKFIGRIIGKALHEGRVLDCHFSRAVYKRILGKKPNLKDLESNDVDYYKSLVWILENDITDILTEEFCVIEDEFGEVKVIDLIPDGRNIQVTEENKKEYVQKLVEYRLTESVKEQLDSFLGGFHDIIPAELICIFNEQELELLISGLPEIDVEDWKANTEYHNYNPSSQQIVWFWRIVKAMTNEERAKLLQFITGTSKVPLNGFKELEGVSGMTKCNIHKDPSTNRLPTSHTCFNQLDLPAYESFEIMKQNITTAINLGADYFGFA